MVVKFHKFVEEEEGVSVCVCVCVLALREGGRERERERAYHLVFTPESQKPQHPLQQQKTKV
jgi:hypothetical protein